MTDVMISAGEAARRLGVAPATIQRWVDNGLLQAERTLGGHRRIYVTEVRRLIASNRTAAFGGPLADWLDVLMTGDAGKVKAALIASRRQTDSWAKTADEVASAIAEMGRRWEAGLCQVFEEHAASEALRRATAACSGEMRRADDALRAALFTIQGERHTLGLSLAELVLAEAGWRTVWIGEGPPSAELASIITKFKPQLLVMSASSASASSAVVRYQSEAMQAATEAGTRLIFAGSGAWRRNAGMQQVVTFKELQSALATAAGFSSGSPQLDARR